MNKKSLFYGLRSPHAMRNTFHVVPMYSAANGGLMFDLTLYGLDDKDVLEDRDVYIHGPMQRRGYSREDYRVGIARRER